MPAKLIKSMEDLKELKFGDEILMEDPLMKQDMPYVLVSRSETKKDYYFKNSYGATLLVKDDETIKAFKLKEIIDDKHPAWDSKLSEHGKQIGDFLSEMMQKMGG